MREFTRKAEAEPSDELGIMHSITGKMRGFLYRQLNDTTYTVVYATPSIETLTGYPASDFVSNAVRTLPSLTEKEDEAYVVGVVQKALERREPWTIDYRRGRHPEDDPDLVDSVVQREGRSRARGRRGAWIHRGGVGNEKARRRYRQAGQANLRTGEGGTTGSCRLRVDLNLTVPGSWGHPWYGA